MPTALGIAPDSDGNGVTPLVHRLCQKAQFENTGLLDGLAVTTNSDLTYTLEAGCAVTSRGDSDGFCIAYFEGGSVSTEAGDASSPRYDVVYIKANDVSQGDSSNVVEAGVVQGTPATSPSIPEVPTGAIAVETLLVPAGMTMTSACTPTDEVLYAVPFGASMGLLGSYSDSYTGDQNWDTTWYQQSSIKVTVPTRRLVEVVYDYRAYIKDRSDVDAVSSWYVKLRVDGVDVTDGNDERPVFYYYCRDRITFLTELSEGTHTISIYGKANTSGGKQFSWGGVRNTYVFDRGLAN